MDVSLHNLQTLHISRTIVKPRSVQPMIQLTDPPRVFSLSTQVKRKSRARTCSTGATLTMLPRYHNYVQYLGSWTDAIASGNGSSNLTHRLPPTGMIYDNTTVQGSWINTQNMTEVSQKFGRIVNNVSMAMPHAGVIAAARDPVNRIMQPQDLNVRIAHSYGSISPA